MTSSNQQTSPSAIHADEISTPPGQGSSLIHGVASAISSIIHPLVYPIVVITVGSIKLGRNSIESTLQLLAVTTVLSTLPVALLVYIQVRRGAWTDLDVSQRKQRYFLYPYTLFFLAVLAFYYHRSGADYAVWCVLALVMANVVNGFINLRWKISAHATTAAACAVILSLFAIDVWLPALLSVVLVSWSRVVLHRHTTLQVIAGSLVGGTCAFVAVHLLGRIG